MKTGDMVIGYNSGSYRSFFVRFPDVTIPVGAIIQSAFVRVKSGATKTSDCYFDIYFNDADDAVAPTSAADANSKALTTETAAWTAGEWTSGLKYDTPDLKTLLQEIVDRPGWASGNAMMAMFLDDSSPDWKVIIAYDTDPDNAPALHVVYDYAP
jgi:hypothetical protein